MLPTTAESVRKRPQIQEMTKSKHNQSHQDSTLAEQTITLAEYAAHPRNYNAHSADQITKLRASLRKFGQVKNIVVWNRLFVAGHGLAQAAAAEGWETLRANVIPDDWPEARVLAYLAADNELARQSDPDQVALAAIIDEVSQFDPELMQAIGYSAAEFDALLAEVGGASGASVTDPGPQIDKADELRQKWGVALGDLWQLGDHRLICGDCTDAATVARLMGGEKAQICFTSPPYNLGNNIQISNRSKSLKDSGSAYDGGEDDLNVEGYLSLLVRFTDIAMVHCDYSFVNLQSLAGNKIALIEYQYHFKDYFADVAIWHKTNQQPAMANNVMNSSFEYIFVLSREKSPTRAIKTGNFRGTFSNVYTSLINNNEFSDVHGAAFPVDFAKHFIESFSGESVYEPFSGTGTCIIACEQLGRKCRAVEISPAYVAVALQRWADATGRQPERIT